MGMCNGYELVRNLDFDDDDSYEDTDNKSTWTSGDGWLPIGTGDNSFTSIFEGNGYTIANLKSAVVSIGLQFGVGLFGVTNNNAMLRNIGLLNVDLTGDAGVSGLVGTNRGAITNSYVTGDLNGVAGGLTYVNTGMITNSYATAITMSNASGG